MPEEYIRKYISHFQADLKDFLDNSSAEKHRDLIRPVEQRTFIKSLIKAIRIRILALQTRYISRRIISRITLIALILGYGHDYFLLCSNRDYSGCDYT